MMVGHQVSLNIDRPAPKDPEAPPGGQPPVRQGFRRCAGAEGRQLHRQLRRDPGHCRHRRLRPEGAAGGHRRPSAAPRAAASCYVSARTTAPPDELLGLIPRQDPGDGRGAVLRAGGPAGHGPGGRHGHDRQHDAAIPTTRAAAPSSTARAPRSWRRKLVEQLDVVTPDVITAGAPAFRRQRAEGAGGPRDRRRPHRADDRLRRARTGHQHLLHHL